MYGILQLKTNGQTSIEIYLCRKILKDHEVPQLEMK